VETAESELGDIRNADRGGDGLSDERAVAKLAEAVVSPTPDIVHAASAGPRISGGHAHRAGLGGCVARCIDVGTGVLPTIF